MANEHFDLMVAPDEILEDHQSSYNPFGEGHKFCGKYVEHECQPHGGAR